jgi:hypothetical protein
MSNPLEFGLACIGALWLALCVVVGLSLIFEAAISRYVAKRMSPPDDPRARMVAALAGTPDLPPEFVVAMSMPSIADDAERWLRESAGSDGA